MLFLRFLHVIAFSRGSSISLLYDSPLWEYGTIYSSLFLRMYTWAVGSSLAMPERAAVCILGHSHSLLQVFLQHVCLVQRLANVKLYKIEPDCYSQQCHLNFLPLNEKMSLQL